MKDHTNHHRQGGIHPNEISIPSFSLLSDDQPAWLLPLVDCLDVRGLLGTLLVNSSCVFSAC